MVKATDLIEDWIEIRSKLQRQLKIKVARKLLGWSQLTLALEANVAPSTVQKFERGESRPSVLCVSTIKRTLEGAGVEFLDMSPASG